jgi:hypothetical protein
MGTMTDDRDNTPRAEDQVPQRDEELLTLPRCARCHLTYLPTKSTSALRLTYCSFLCELGDLGFSMTGLEHMELVKKTEQPAEPVTND